MNSSASGNGNGQRALLAGNAGYRSTDIQELARDLEPLVRSEHRYTLKVAILKVHGATQGEVARVTGTNLHDVRLAQLRLQRVRDLGAPAPESLGA